MSARFLGNAARPGDTAFCGLPLFHANAALATGIAAFLQGSRVLLGTPQGYRGPGLVDRFWEIVAHHRITYFSGVPTLFAALLGRPAEGYDLSSLRYCFCGAAPLPADSIRAFEAMTGARLLEGYGLTEGTCVSTINPYAGERRPGSVGLRLPFGELRPLVLDPEGAYLRDAAVGEPGAVCISGPHVFQGYLSADDSLWIARGDGRRWFNTGDLGRLDAEGYLWLTGRAKDIIIRGGHNIDPATIEDALHRHPRRRAQPPRSAAPTPMRASCRSPMCSFAPGRSRQRTSSSPSPARRWVSAPPPPRPCGSSKGCLRRRWARSSSRRCARWRRGASSRRLWRRLGSPRPCGPRSTRSGAWW